jgi:serine/threonine protein kinase
MPESFGSYKILGTLGSGGMGTVYRARDAKRRVVALKVMSPDLLDDRTARWRFEREPKLHVLHPNIVEVYDNGNMDGYPYFAMRFVEGKSLSHILAEQARLTPEQFLPILRGVAAGMDATHKRGIVHRDVKPSNILVDTSKRPWHPYLTDFGVAMLLADNAAPTPTGVRSGTPRYMAPEQAKRQLVSAQSDVYSLGVVAFEALTGRPPFDSNSDTSVIEMHQRMSPPSVRAYNPNIPTNVANVILRALAKDPNERYKSAGEFAFAYEKALAASPITNTRARTALVMALMVSILAVLIATGAVLYLSSRGSEVESAASAEADATATALAASGVISDTVTLEPTLEPTLTETPSATPRPTRRATVTRTPTPLAPAATATPVPQATATLKSP